MIELGLLKEAVKTSSLNASNTISLFVPDHSLCVYFFPYFFQDRLEIPTSSYNIFNLQLFSRSYPFHQMPINRFQFMKSSPTKTLIFFLSVEKWLTGSAITCVFVRLFLRFQPIFLQNHRLDFFH